MTLAEFEPKFPASERLHTHAGAHTARPLGPAIIDVNTKLNPQHHKIRNYLQGRKNMMFQRKLSVKTNEK